MRLFVAIDRTGKCAFVELHQQAGKMIAARFLRNLIVVLPYAIFTVLTDAASTSPIAPANRPSITSSRRSCDENRIKHRFPRGPTARSSA